MESAILKAERNETKQKEALPFNFPEFVLCSHTPALSFSNSLFFYVLVNHDDDLGPGLSRSATWCMFAGSTTDLEEDCDGKHSENPFALPLS